MNRDTANFQATPTRTYIRSTFYDKQHIANQSIVHSQNPSQLLSSSTGRAPLSTGLPHLDKALIPPVNHAANTPADILPAASQFALPGWTQLGPSAAGAEGGNGNVDSGSNENGDAEGPQTPLSPGIRRGEITELSGPRGSGKTSLA